MLLVTGTLFFSLYEMGSKESKVRQVDTKFYITVYKVMHLKPGFMRRPFVKSLKFIFLFFLFYWRFFNDTNIIINN